MRTADNGSARSTDWSGAGRFCGGLGRCTGHRPKVKQRFEEEFHDGCGVFGGGPRSQVKVVPRQNAARVFFEQLRDRCGTFVFADHAMPRRPVRPPQDCAGQRQRHGEPSSISRRAFCFAAVVCAATASRSTTMAACLPRVSAKVGSRWTRVALGWPSQAIAHLA